MNISPINFAFSCTPYKKIKSEKQTTSFGAYQGKTPEAFYKSYYTQIYKEPIAPQKLEEIEKYKKHIEAGNAFIFRNVDESYYFAHYDESGSVKLDDKFSANGDMTIELSKEPELAGKLLTTPDNRGKLPIQFIAANYLYAVSKIMVNDKETLKELLKSKDANGNTSILGFTDFRKINSRIEYLFRDFSDDPDFIEEIFTSIQSDGNTYIHKTFECCNDVDLLNNIDKIYKYFMQNKKALRKLSLTPNSEGLLPIDVSTLVKTKIIVEGMKNFPDLVDEMFEKTDKNGQNFPFKTGYRGIVYLNNLYKDKPQELAKIYSVTDYEGNTAAKYNPSVLIKVKSLIKSPLVDMEAKENLKRIYKKDFILLENLPQKNAVKNKTKCEKTIEKIEENVEERQKLEEKYLTTNEFGLPKVYFILSSSKATEKFGEMQKELEKYPDILKRSLMIKYRNGETCLHKFSAKHCALIRKMFKDDQNMLAKLYLTKDDDGKLPIETDSDKKIQILKFGLANLIKTSKYGEEIKEAYAKYL